MQNQIGKIFNQGKNSMKKKKAVGNRNSAPTSQDKPPFPVDSIL